MRETITPTLYLAIELSMGKWVLAFGDGQQKRQWTIPARDLGSLLQKIVEARAYFKMEEPTRLVSCYEAGRDGFWLHRFLGAHGIDNLVMDAASIEVPRRHRRRKTDCLDAAGLLRVLIRYDRGEHEVLSTVVVPSEAHEDRRRLHRERERLLKERTQHVNRMKGDLITIGLMIRIDRHFARRLEEAQTWDGKPLPGQLKQTLLREYQRWVLVCEQIKELETQQRQAVHHESSACMEKLRALIRLKSINIAGGWPLVMEVFGWRQFRNRKELGGFSGLTPTPYNSGGSEREQGISKAGNRRIRTLMVELAWMWLRWQPHSQLSRWYENRFGGGGKRMRKLGIVALARKLLIALWHYLEHGVVPQGAEFKRA